jgi:hypothetical protein
MSQDVSRKIVAILPCSVSLFGPQLEQWCLKLSCGHEVYVHTDRKPRKGTRRRCPLCTHRKARS